MNQEIAVMADKANGVQRWEVDFSVGYEGSHAAAWMAKADDGEYVSYSDYEQLQAKREAAERDAARWRWLRENAHPGFTQSGKAWGLLCASLEVRTWQQIDAAIDAAIDAQRQEGK